MDNIDNNTNKVVNPSDKKKRGRKKNSVIVCANNDDQDSLIATENTKEKKPRKKRTKKGESNISVVETDVNLNINAHVNANVTEDTPISLIKKRKRRTRKDIENAQIANTNTNIIVSSINDTNDNNTDNQTDEVKEEKVAKKRGRKPKGGKITIQTLSNSHIQNELPNIILHLKCSLSDLNKNNIEVNETFDTINNNGVCNNNIATSSSISNSNSNNTETIQSYNSTNAVGSEINNNIDRGNNNSSSTGTNITLYHRDLLMNNAKNSHSQSQTITNVHNMITKDDSHTKDSSLNETYSSAMFQVYDPCIVVDTQPQPQPQPQPDSCNMAYYRNSNEIINNNPASLFSTIYSPDIISYSQNQNNTFGGIIPTQLHDDEYTNASNLNERDIWKKINQLKISFHKSDICQNTRSTSAQRSACFWCTCEFDSPAIYIPKSVLKDMYNVYGCFCSPECAAAFLMNESIDTSTKFERYHLLNSLYGKIYKHEKSIKIAPNPYYLLNKFYGNLSIQEYRKLFQSDQMIYIVNKPLTHILPELYEDNNDFLLNNKIIPTNSVNLKKKVLKSNL